MTTITANRPRAQPQVSRQSPSLHLAAGSQLSAQEEQLRSKLEAYVRDQFGGDFKRAFRATDANGDGQVDKKELTGLLANAGAGGLFREAVANRVMDRFDTDRSTGISWGEFQGGMR